MYCLKLIHPLFGATCLTKMPISPSEESCYSQEIASIHLCHEPTSHTRRKTSTLRLIKRLFIASVFAILFGFQNKDVQLRKPVEQQALHRTWFDFMPTVWSHDRGMVFLPSEGLLYGWESQGQTEEAI